MKENKVKIAITIDIDIDKKLNEERINKSKLINWLLTNHYNNIKK